MHDELGNSMYPDDVCGYNEPRLGLGRMPEALVKHQGLESTLACVVECGEIPWSVRTKRTIYNEENYFNADSSPRHQTPAGSFTEFLS